MSGRMLQGLVLQMKDVSERVIGVIDSTGTVVACSDLSEIGAKRDVALASLYDSTDVCATADGYTYKPLSNWSVRFDYAVFISGEDELARSLCLMASVALNNAKNFYDEKHDKAFIKNIILDNILSGILYQVERAQLPDGYPHVVFLIRLVDKTDILDGCAAKPVSRQAARLRYQQRTGYRSGQGGSQRRHRVLGLPKQ